MARLKLSDDLLCGVDDIDAQHRRLFELANLALEPSLGGTDATFFSSLAFLSEYVNYHFAAEELAMTQSGYPATHQHCRWHAEFRQLVAELLELSLEAADITELKVRLADAIGVWFAQHIRVADKALAAYLREHAGADSACFPDEAALIQAGISGTHGAESRQTSNSTE